MEAGRARDGQVVWTILEMLRPSTSYPIPIIAAVHGNCLGGGMEMELGLRPDHRLGVGKIGS